LAAVLRYAALCIQLGGILLSGSWLQF